MRQPNFQSCNQNWQEMPFKNDNRWCHLCQQCVVDFRTKDIANIKQIQKESAGKTCGIYTKNQIEELYPAVNFPAFLRLRNIAAAIFTSLIFNISAAESITNHLVVPIENTFKSTANKLVPLNKQSIINDTITVKGIVKDSINSEPLIGVSIYIEGTEQGTISNIDGEFELSFLPTAGDSLMVSYTGYYSQVFSLNQSTNLAVQLVQNPNISICYVGGITTPKYKIWQKGFWRNLFRKKH